MNETLINGVPVPSGVVPLLAAGVYTDLGVRELLFSNRSRCELIGNGGLILTPSGGGRVVASPEDIEAAFDDLSDENWTDEAPRLFVPLGAHFILGENGCCGCVLVNLHDGDRAYLNLETLHRSLIALYGQAYRGTSVQEEVISWWQASIDEIKAGDDVQD